MDSTTLLRVGIAGYGYTGKQLERALERAGGAELVAVAETDPVKRAGARVPAFESYRELIADPSIDAIVVCLPHSIHEEVASAALEAGKHLLVEKPLCVSAEAGERVCELARKAGKVLMVEMTHRFVARCAAHDRRWGHRRDTGG
jgi:predicted dehydrogenase